MASLCSPDRVGEAGFVDPVLDASPPPPHEWTERGTLQRLSGRPTMFRCFDADSEADDMAGLADFDFDSFLRDVPEGPSFGDFSFMQSKKWICYDEATKLSKNYLRAIIEIHHTFKGQGEAKYPHDLQNLLLTASRTISTIAMHLDGLPEGKASEDAEPLATFLSDVRSSKQICQETRSLLLSTTFHKEKPHSQVWKQQERKVCMNLLPILLYYKQVKYGSLYSNKDIMNLEYESFPREDDDANTELGDTVSILSDATLLGVMEEKETSKEYSSVKVIDVTESDKQEEMRSNSYLCGLIRLPTKADTSVVNSSVPEPKHMPGIIGKAASALTPTFLKRKQDLKHAEKLQRTMQSIRDAAANNTLHDPKLLADKLTREAITETELLSEAVAMRENGYDLMKWLLKYGAPVDGVGLDKAAFAPLGHAVRGGTPEACEILIKAGAKLYNCRVGRRNCDNEDPLAHAVRWRRPQIVEVLLKHRTFDHEVRKLYDDGEENLETSLHRAAGDKDGYKVLEVLLKDARVLRHIDLRAGPKMNTPLHHAAAANNVLAIRLLLDAGADLESRNLRLCTPLHWAIKHRNVEASNHLIRNAGADVNAPRIRLEPPLKYAVCHGSQEIVEALASHGALLNEPTSEGKSALHSAAAYESTSLVRTLLDYGADVNCRSAYGSTPLFLAAQNGRIATAKLLLERGANPKLCRTGHKSKNPRDPMYIAKRGLNFEVVRLLECWDEGKDFGNVADNAEIEKDADDHECSWEYWFGKYVVKVYEKELAAEAWGC